MNIYDYDKTIDNAKFITKVDNVFTLLCTSIMQGNMDRCKHKISNDLYERYLKQVELDNAQNLRQMYDEFNINRTEIINIKNSDAGITVNVKILTKYMDYKVNKDNFKLVSGNNTRRIEKEYNLTFFKKKDAKELKIVRRCPGCGAPADVSNTGVCSYCGTIFNTEDYDYVLINVE